MIEKILRIGLTYDQKSFLRPYFDGDSVPVSDISKMRWESEEDDYWK